MKRFVQLALFFMIAHVLVGCPYDSPYGIDAEEHQNIDETLLGNWAVMVKKPGNDKQQKEDPVKIIFSRNTDLEYGIVITGDIGELKSYHVITNDSIKGIAYPSTVYGRQFLNIFIRGKVYIAEVKKRDKTLSILCLAEHFTAKYIKNSTELRKAIEFHYRVSASPMYDDYFVLDSLQRVN